MSWSIDIKKNHKIIHVVALVLQNHQGKILVAKRSLKQDQGGLWEFPGGKVEAGETRLIALKREIKEELDYTLETATPLKCITHKYNEHSIKLDVWFFKDTNPKESPKVYANENQPLRWVTLNELKSLPMPKADIPIIEELGCKLLVWSS